MVDNVHRGGMGAVALQRMQDEGVDVIALWKRNEATKGMVYKSDWFRAKIEEYTQLLHA
jgi:hypothetical protein